MKEIAIPLTWLAIFVILFLIIGNVSISFKPFHIYIPDWPKALGIILMIAGLLLFCCLLYTSSMAFMANTLTNYYANNRSNGD